MFVVFQTIAPFPTPSMPGKCVPPPRRWWGGGGHIRLVERGWGVNILEDARHCSVLCKRKYFVVCSKSC